MARSLILAASPSESGTRTKLECRFPCRAGARVLGTLEIARRQWGIFPQTEACASGGAVLASAEATPQAQFFADLYFEATGNRKRARTEITTAADHYTTGEYKHGALVVHREHSPALES